MKIKTWLLLTYLLVMLLPLGAFYGLYVSINNYYQDKNFAHYFSTWSTVTELKKQLEDPALYEENASYTTVEKLTSDALMITLYNASGRVLFSSNPISNFSAFEAKNNLYKSLYELKQNYKSFVYKEPIYQNGTIVGIYKVTLPRTEWSEQVNNKTSIVIAALVIFLVVLYLIVIYFLNRRLNRPLQQLIRNMQAFAKGQPTPPLASTRDEIGQLAANFEQMQNEIRTSREQLEAEQRQKEFMIASLSHDLKTPLTSIQAYAESLLGGKLSRAEQQEYLQVIHGKSDYMKQLLDDLMMFTLLQSPTYELELVEVEGAEFFEMLLSDYESISIEKGFHATTSVNVSGSYRVNPKQLMRVLDNIVSNAWTYTNDEGTIRIAAFEQTNVPAWCNTSAFTKQGAYIVVQNSGTTLSQEACTQMFEPLHQLDASRSHIGQRGAGLGLSIARQILDKHDGTIRAVSKNNETAIIIWLPKESL